LARYGVQEKRHKGRDGAEIIAAPANMTATRMRLSGKFPRNAGIFGLARPLLISSVT
jgi:hypothetical protein